MPFPTFDDETSLPPPPKDAPTIGKWLAIGIPGVFAAAALLGFLWVLPDIRKRPASATESSCLYNLGELYHGITLYESDHDDRLPSAGWNDALGPYLRKVPEEELIFACPVQRRIDPQTSGYALNTSAAGKSTKEITEPDQTIVVFDSKDVRKSAIDPVQSLASPGRHEQGRKDSALFLSGVAKPVNAP